MQGKRNYQISTLCKYRIQRLVSGAVRRLKYKSAATCLKYFYIQQCYTIERPDAFVNKTRKKHDLQISFEGAETYHMENYKWWTSPLKKKLLNILSFLMRILSVFDKFKDSFSAQEACILAEDAAKDVSSDIQLVSCPLTDGGEGFVDILTPKYAGELLNVEARDAFDKEKRRLVSSKSGIYLQQYAPLNLPNRELAAIEMASVCGLTILPQSNETHGSLQPVGWGSVNCS